MAIRESILGLPLNKDLNPTVKNLYPATITGNTRINCIIPKFLEFFIGSIISGKWKPNGSPNICPIVITKSGTVKIADITNFFQRVFISLSFLSLSASTVVSSSKAL
ncbi:hypothetical protein SDC9_151596 [bioreactor metagenome]|uniref:Uncharacterized protein n=1 Tax=bioreactor metagenome TaxID=1076179 RepID=A0A645ET31_9ZZZZ